MATLSRNVLVSVLIEGANKLSVKEVAQKLGCEEKEVRSGFNQIKSTYDGLKKKANDEPNNKAENGMTNSKFFEMVNEKYGVDLSKIKPRDSRGRQSKSVLDKLGISLEDLEV